MTETNLPPTEILTALYERMLLIRKVEEKIAELYPEQEIKCPTHLSIGQEACAAGVCTALEQNDYVFSTHRCHSHYLGKGGDVKQMFAELYGRSTGCAKGKGGSMHLVDPEVSMMGASAIVGGTIPLAVGAALAARFRGERRVAVAFFGDAACEQGVFHESMNFAALKKLPVLFVCENNFFATQTPFSARQSLDNIWERGKAHGVPGWRLDGTNVIEVYQGAKEAVSRARKGEGPALLECRAYRWKEHVGPNYDYNMGYRTKEELDDWVDRCPIRNLESSLRRSSPTAERDVTEIQERVNQTIEAAIQYAKQSPQPEARELLTEIV